MKIEIPHPDEIDTVGTHLIIHPWDTWSMDHTLSYIIVPMLEQLKATKHGYPSDLTEERWDEILDEMIWAFTFKRDHFNTLMEKNPKATQERLSNAFRLFGEYYENLWD
jgi:hypothetical protein